VLDIGGGEERIHGCLSLARVRARSLVSVSLAEVVRLEGSLWERERRQERGCRRE
jgi:hypothetical protein